MQCPACSKPLPELEIPPEVEKTIEEEMAKANEPPEGELDHEAAEAMLEEPASKETMVWRERLAQSFQAANVSNIAGVDAAEELRLQKENSTLENFVEAILERFSVVNLEKFEEYFKLVSGVGRYSILVAGLLFMARSVLLAMNNNSPDEILYGVLGLISTMVLYYVAAKFPRVALLEIRKRELMINSREIPFSFGFACIGGAVGSALAGAYFGITSKNVFLVVAFLAPAVAGAHAGVLFLSPSVLNTRISRASATAGETGLGLIGYVIRVMLLLSGLFLAAIPILALALLYSLFAQSFSLGVFQVCAAIIYIALWPLASYLLYLFYRIVLDFYRVVFGISQDLVLMANEKSSSNDN
jgi:hypothetical protein